MSAYSIERLDASGRADRELEALLTLAYVGGGCTEPSLADSLFNGPSVRARGDVLVAKDSTGPLLGSAVVVASDSPARRFAMAGEAELHLLCVHPGQRGRGIGSALVSAAVETARRNGATRMILWTQPTMIAAQALYQRHNFARVPELDFSRGSRSFRVFARVLDPA